MGGRAMVYLTDKYKTVDDVEGQVQKRSRV